MTKILSFLFCAIALYSISACQQAKVDTSNTSTIDKTKVYQQGDLLFQDLDCGPLCDAIEAVTPGYDNSNFSHMGMLVNHDGAWMVLEAISPAVRLTPLVDFLAYGLDEKQQAKIVHMRHTQWGEAQNTALDGVLSTHMNKPYDNIYLMDDSTMYCSELIYQVYEQLMPQGSGFELAPMTFKNPKDTLFNPAWMAYYEELQHDIPEGALGINPGLMSTNAQLTYIQHLGKVSTK